ncbi:MAG: anti-sigma factor antagonist [Clostridiales bacterium]|nr:anti-sigma factor antagonist [Clostridiales bacterium]
MRLTVKKQGDKLLVVMKGELDQNAADGVRERLESELDDESVRRMEFDMGGVTFMDSSGIGVLLGRYRRLKKRGGGMDVLNAPKQVEKILRMSGVYTLCTKRSSR